MLTEDQLNYGRIHARDISDALHAAYWAPSKCEYFSLLAIGNFKALATTLGYTVTKIEGEGE